MHNIFQYDNPIMSFFQKVIELFLLNIMWIVCCIPLVTIGAATTALHKVLLNDVQKSGQPLSDYWKYFRSNFRQATIIWLIMFVSGIALIFDWYFLFQIGSSPFRTVGFIFTAASSVVYAFVLTFVFPLQANFYNRITDTFKNALRLSFANPIGSIALTVFNAIPLLLIVFTDIGVYLLVIDVALVTALEATIFNKIFNLFLAESN